MPVDMVHDTYVLPSRIGSIMSMQSLIPIVIYRITCNMTNKIYIGNKQHHFKMQMKGYFQNLKKLMEKGVHSDSALHQTLCQNLAQRRSRSTMTRDAGCSGT
jgi:hypothetical protein